MLLDIPRHEVEALVKALEHYTFGYTVDAQHAAAAWRKLAHCVEGDRDDGQSQSVVDTVAARGSDGVIAVDRELSSRRAPGRSRAVTHRAVACPEDFE